MTDRTPPFLLVGEAPNAATEHRPELWLLPDDSGVSHAANRLREFSGYSHRTYRGLFERDNLLHALPPRQAKGRAFPVDLARAQSARVVRRAAEKHQAIVVLGRRAARAFQWYFRYPEGRIRAVTEPMPLQFGLVAEWDTAGFLGGAVRGAMVPHPSAVNRWWNEARNRDAARRFFDALLEAAEVDRRMRRR